MIYYEGTIATCLICYQVSIPNTEEWTETKQEFDRKLKSLSVTLTWDNRSSGNAVQVKDLNVLACAK